MQTVAEQRPAGGRQQQGTMPVNPEKTGRKTLNLPLELLQRVKSFRHRHELDTEAAAYIALLERGLEAFEAEERQRTGRKGKGEGER